MATHARGEEYGRLVLLTIREIRVQHSACTAREIARRLQVAHPLVLRQLDTLHKAGLVEWTGMPGSIHLTGRGGKVASGGAMPDLPVRARGSVVHNRTLAEPERDVRPTINTPAGL